MDGTLLLILGLALWWAAHLFKRVAPNTRATLGNRGKGLVALAIAVGVILMIFGYRSAEEEYLFSPPAWAWQVNNILMFLAIFLMDVGRAKGVVRTYIRHPMLTGVLVWAIAHVLVNPDDISLILFGGLGLWAIVEMIVISRAEGPWSRPERGVWMSDLKVAAIAGVIYAVIVGIHYWLLGYSVIAF